MITIFNDLNHLNYDFYFLAIDPFLSISLPQLSNFYVLSPETLQIKLAQKNSGRLLSHSKTIDHIVSNSKATGHRVAIIPFKPSAKIEFICRQHDWDLIANPASINRLLEDKIKFYHLCRQHHLPVIDSLIGHFDQKLYTEAQSKFGPKLVIQTHHGWAGNSSYTSTNFSDLSHHLSPNTLVKICPHLDGYTLINNCVLTPKGLIQSPPGLQYTGIAPLTNNPLATVGRQWPSTAPKSVDQQISQITRSCVTLLHDLSYKGFFGLDFLVSQEQVYLLECNPRLTASFAFYTDLEIQQQLNPLFGFHLMTFIGPDYSIDIDTECLRINNPSIVGSEITQKNTSGQTTAKYNHHSQFCSSPNNITLKSDILNHLL